MTDIAIRVENLSKLYHIGALQQRHDTLRDALANALPRISRKINSINSSHSWQKGDNNSSKDRPPVQRYRRFRRDRVLPGHLFSTNWTYDSLEGD